MRGSNTLSLHLPETLPQGFRVSAVTICNPQAGVRSHRSLSTRPSAGDREKPLISLRRISGGKKE